MKVKLESLLQTAALRKLYQVETEITHPSNEYGLTRGSVLCAAKSVFDGSMRTSSTSSNQISLQRQHISFTLLPLWL